MTKKLVENVHLLKKIQQNILNQIILIFIFLIKIQFLILVVVYLAVLNNFLVGYD